MDIENQVVSLELAKKLKELGVKQESYFRWLDSGVNLITAREIGEYPTAWENGISAFTVAELGEMLPVRTQTGRRKYLNDGLPVWYCNYAQKGNKLTYQKSANTEADARAKMLIYLIENKLITL